MELYQPTAPQSRFTKFMLFGARQLTGKLSDITITFLGRDLSPSPICIDLGVIFYSNLSFDSSVNHQSSPLPGNFVKFIVSDTYLQEKLFQSFRIL